MIRNDYSNLMPIDSFINTSVKWHHGDVTYGKFREKYSITAIQWLGLKVIAVPGVFLGLVKAVVHLALGVLCGVLVTPWDKGRTLKYYSFCVARDLQESCGALLSLVYLSYGRYHVLEAQTQKSFYDEELKNDLPYSIPSSRSTSSSSGSRSTNSNLSGRSSSTTGNVVPQKLKGVDFHQLFPYNGTDNKARFALLDGKQVKLAVEKGEIENRLLELLSDDHLKALDPLKLNYEIFTELFPYNGTDDKARFAFLNKEKVKLAVEKREIYGERLLELLSDDHLKALDPSKLNDQIFAELFPYNGTDNKARFALLDKKQLKQAVEKNEFSVYRLIDLLSIDVIKLLDFTKVTQTTINALFPFWEVESLRKKHTIQELSVINGKVFNKRYCKFSDKKLTEMSKKQKEKNDTLLKQLSGKQKSDLLSKLYVEEGVNSSSKESPFG